MSEWGGRDYRVVHFSAAGPVQATDSVGEELKRFEGGTSAVGRDVNVFLPVEAEVKGNAKGSEQYLCLMHRRGIRRLGRGLARCVLGSRV